MVQDAAQRSGSVGVGVQLGIGGTGRLIASGHDQQSGYEGLVPIRRRPGLERSGTLSVKRESGHGNVTTSRPGVERLVPASGTSIARMG